MSLTLRAHQIEVSYPGGDGSLLPALGPVSFSVPAGQFMCLMGPSGCGKSTLIRVFAGLQPPTSGNALAGKDIIREPSLNVGLMFQDATLMPWRTVLENIALPLELAGVPRQQRFQAASSLLPMLGLEAFAGHYPASLSGGMAQRTALGRVLAQKPGVLLLDEPFGALDAMTREQISLDLLNIWQAERQTILMVTHDVQEAVFLADRVLVMSRRPGQIIADVEVMLPRPRTVDMIYSIQFGSIARELRQLITRA
jgi:NitT/TauT family transport system ATP-binding protein